MMQGFASVPPVEALLYRVLAVQATIGPLFVQVIGVPLDSVVVPPGVWFQAGCPLPEVPRVAVADCVPLALTETSCCTLPLESTSSPIVVNSVAAVQGIAAAPEAVTTTVGALVGPTMPQFHCLPPMILMASTPSAMKSVEPSCR